MVQVMTSEALSRENLYLTYLPYLLTYLLSKLIFVGSGNADDCTEKVSQ